MDHGHYDFSPKAYRQNPFKDSSFGILGYVVLYLEHWEFLPEESWRRDPRWMGEFGSFFPDYRTWTQREYGLRVGIFRVIEALEEMGIKPAIAANSAALQRLPNLIKIFNQMECEWIGHGVSINHMMHSKMSFEEQQKYIEQSLRAVKELTGKTSKGWVSQDWGTTNETPNLLSKLGVKYTLDWPNDDQPYFLKNNSSRQEGTVLSIPLSSEYDDVQSQWFRNLNASDFQAICTDGLTHLSREWQTTGTQSIYGLGLHPWLCGMPNRIKYLKQTLQELKKNKDVRWVSPQDIFNEFTVQA